MLLVEQLIDKALGVANRVYAMSQGKVVLESPADAANLHARIEQAYFGAHAVAL